MDRRTKPEVSTAPKACVFRGTQEIDLTSARLLLKQYSNEFKLYENNFENF